MYVTVIYIYIYIYETIYLNINIYTNTCKYFSKYMLYVCVCVYVVYEDTNLYNDMGMT